MSGRSRIGAVAALTGMCALWLAGCRAPSSSDSPESRVWDVRPGERVVTGSRPDTPRGEERVSPQEQGGTRGGRWFRARRAESRIDPTPEQKRAIERLESIGYVSGSHAPKDRPIVARYDPDRAQDGYNFYTSGHAPEAILRDMQGRELHRWTMPFQEAFPGRAIEPQNAYFRRAHLFENGDILVIFEGHGIVKLDKDSRVIWMSDIRAHHDLQVMPDGDVYVLTREARMIPEIHATKPVLEDFISVLDTGGVERRRVSVLESVRTSEYAELFRNSSVRDGDLFHTNTLEVMDGSLAGEAPWLANGSVLVSLLMLDVVAVIDMQQQQVTKAWMGSFRKQHDPKLLENGHMLLFDNRGGGRHSVVLEFDPITSDVKWEYRGTDEEPFYTRTCGTAERLPNGNTLITESDYGRAFEVTPEREIVWEFFNPDRAGDEGQFVAALLEMIRLPPDFPLGWIKRPR